MNVFGLVFGSGSGIERIDLHEHLLVRLLKQSEYEWLGREVL